MDILSIIIVFIGIISSIISILTGIPQIIYSFITNIPKIKKFIAWARNEEYKVQLTGRKKYHLFEPNMKQLKTEIRKKYNGIGRDSTKGDNWLVVLIQDMQAPFKITILDEQDMDDFHAVPTECMVTITLQGSVNFKYRDSFENKKFINIMNDLFKIIEKMENKVPIIESYLIKATFDDGFKREPFISSVKIDKCEDTKVEIKKKIISINSQSSNNLYKCLKKNIFKII
ncbi:hypothetical protein KQY27_03215 [Methanobrevibacter sp. TMH8]|uniref:hypothetical protein n=1 Tax=Methanobrevibacter sp. TMH8 TaxID=2848611 RepID=UPI001CCDD351|nr:hypothetical protein [Methanobrevibacter sp. TMH8]MBZ9570554.1 hypothetical protein [Methanobrevibacter sp. TMH8]